MNSQSRVVFAACYVYFSICAPFSLQANGDPPTPVSPGNLTTETSPDEVAVSAEATGMGIVSYGVYGMSHSTIEGSAGVVGQTTGDSFPGFDGWTYGVLGLAGSQNSIAGHFENTGEGYALSATTNSVNLSVGPYGGSMSGGWGVSGSTSSFNFYGGAELGITAGSRLRVYHAPGIGGGDGQILVDGGGASLLVRNGGLLEISDATLSFTGTNSRLLVDAWMTVFRPLDVQENVYGKSFYVNDSNGRVVTPTLEITAGADLAEWFEIVGNNALEPGTVVSIDPEVVGAMMTSSVAYDTRAAGIVSGAGGLQPGVTLSQSPNRSPRHHLVALAGRAWCLADADVNGPIQPGDQLTTSKTVGHAMKATDVEKSHGSIIGKAMSKLETGQGLVLVLVGLN